MLYVIHKNVPIIYYDRIFCFRGGIFMKKSIADNLNAALLANPKRLEELKKKALKITSDEDLHTFIKEEIIPIAKKENINITEKELFNNEKKAFKKLNEKNLENISGGVSAKQFIIGGSLLSLILFSAGTTNNLLAHADNPTNIPSIQTISTPSPTPSEGKPIDPSSGSISSDPRVKTKTIKIAKPAFKDTARGKIYELKSTPQQKRKGYVQRNRIIRAMMVEAENLVKEEAAALLDEYKKLTPEQQESLPQDTKSLIDTAKDIISSSEAKRKKRNEYEIAKYHKQQDKIREARALLEQGKDTAANSEEVIEARKIVEKGDKETSRRKKYNKEYQQKQRDLLIEAQDTIVNKEIADASSQEIEKAQKILDRKSRKIQQDRLYGQQRREQLAKAYNLLEEYELLTPEEKAHLTPAQKNELKIAQEIVAKYQAQLEKKRIYVKQYQRDERNKVLAAGDFLDKHTELDGKQKEGLSLEAKETVKNAKEILAKDVEKKARQQVHYQIFFKNQQERILKARALVFEYEHLTAEQKSKLTLAQRKDFKWAQEFIDKTERQQQKLQNYRDYYRSSQKRDDRKRQNILKHELRVKQAIRELDKEADKLLTESDSDPDDIS